jgi:DNA-binding transcriptional regulator YdaS (Cro superfamily)
MNETLVISALSRAVKAAGGQAKLAEALGIYQSAVAKWVANKRVPAERVLAVEKITGVSRHELRPDIYPTDAGA